MIEDKVTVDDYRLSPLLSTENQFECFRKIKFILYFAEKDYMFPQQLAFKDMLDSYKIPNTLQIFKNIDHLLGFFKFSVQFS